MWNTKSWTDQGREQKEVEFEVEDEDEVGAGTGSGTGAGVRSRRCLWSRSCIGQDVRQVRAKCRCRTAARSPNDGRHSPQPSPTFPFVLAFTGW